MHRRRFLQSSLATGVAFQLAEVRAQAAPWPTRPVRLVVVYPSGGVSDAVARLLAPRLAAQLGTPWVVENKGGAGGSIGMDAVAKSPPDGTSFAFSAVSPLTLNPHVGRVPYDPLVDLVPVASVMYSPVYLLGTPLFTGRSFDDLLSIARARPGMLRLATSGIASVGHLMLEQLRDKAKVDIIHVPYKGGGQPITDAVGGQFELFTTNPSSAVNPHVERGTLRLLAVGAPRRLEAHPDVPTLAELGFAEANLTSTFGVFAPAGTPPEIVRRLNEEIGRALALPEIRDRLVRSDNVPAAGTPDDFARLVRSEYASNARIVRAANIRAD